MRGIWILSAFLLSHPVAVAARPVDPAPVVIFQIPAEIRAVPGAYSLSSAVFLDTVRYGGTTWMADSTRWEAIRDSVWTFDTGVGSAFGPTGPNKPAGYHTRMEGWFGVDETLSQQAYFRRSSTCAIAGSFSLWAGVTAAEAQDLCFASGQGYGNNWNLFVEKTFAYPGSGSVTLDFDYAIDTEPLFDYQYVLIDTTGNGTAPDIQLLAYDGLVSGSESIVLNPGSTLRSSSGDFTLKFNAVSDGSYSDQDGLDPSTCGHSVIDNIALSGAVVDFTDFESGDNGWVPFIPTTGVGDYSNVVDSNTLLSASYCDCAYEDSVLVFFDTLNQHPTDQDNRAVSPWIDLKRGGDVGRAGRVFEYDVYGELPLNNNIFYVLEARWYPSICAVSGGVRTSPFADEGFLFGTGEDPACSSGGNRFSRDFSGVIPATAEQVQLSMRVVNICVPPLYSPCTGSSNSTPWFDNIALGVFGPATTPLLTLDPIDRFQDSFATAGILSPARLDVVRQKSANSLFTGDTLVASGDGGNTEVRIVFHVRPGPATSVATLNAWATQWTAEPSIGPDWYSARMDTAEQGGVVAPGKWMTTFHESDPGFAGTDQTPDPIHPSQLENEIFPDQILQPGGRIDYFLAARYIPPDPRNTGDDWFIMPDTTGGAFLEVEVLPSSMDSNSTWNCTLYVDRYDNADPLSHFVEESALQAALGPGSSNAENTRYDRWDTPYSGGGQFARPAGKSYGVTLQHILAYKTIAWHAGSGGLSDDDAGLLDAWLASSSGDFGLWMTGNGVSGNTAFRENTMGALRPCTSVLNANCPPASSPDSAACLPLSAVAGSAFPAGLPAGIRTDICGTHDHFDLFDVNPAVPTATGQLNYVKLGVDAPYASITTSPGTHRTVLDGFAHGLLRTNSGNPYDPANCSDITAAIDRAVNVLAWLGVGTGCTQAVSDVPEDPRPTPSPPRPRLGHAAPNPVAGSTTIHLTQGPDGGRLQLRIYDVAGRLIRTLLDGAVPTGDHEVAWDGRNDAGRPVGQGLYFYRMTSPGYQGSRKLLVRR